jgi:Putative peptidoglycan binding domain
MRSILAPSLASLAVLYALIVVLSGHHGIPSGSRLINDSERISAVGDRLMQTIVLRRQRQSKDYPASPSTDRIMKVQQALKHDGFHSRSVDGTMRHSTHEVLRSFQESNLVNVTATIDDHTTRELGLHLEAYGQ